jgi:hypothetical protein
VLRVYWVGTRPSTPAARRDDLRIHQSSEGFGRSEAQTTTATGSYGTCPQNSPPDSQWLQQNSVMFYNAP